MQEKVTLIVLPRERFGLTEESLESIYQNTNFPFKLIYVDCNSPTKTKTYLEAKAKEKGFHLIRTKEYISPNQARNIALNYVDTEYVVFIDNDVLVKPGWLEAMVNCADETGAWVVGPLCLEGADFAKVHMAGGTYESKQRGDKKWMIMRRPFFRTPLSKVRVEFKRQATEAIEFHCVLTRMDVFKQLGPLDEQVMGMGQEDDLCFTVLQAGKPIYFEPASVITYVPPSNSNLEWSDMPFFYVRWSQAWCDVSIKRICEKWNLTADSPMIKNLKQFPKGHSSSPEPKPQEGWGYITYIVKSKTMRLVRKLINWQTSIHVRNSLNHS